MRSKEDRRVILWCSKCRSFVNAEVKGAGEKIYGGLEDADGEMKKCGHTIKLPRSPARMRMGEWK